MNFELDGLTNPYDFTINSYDFTINPFIKYHKNKYQYYKLIELLDRINKIENYILAKV